jgi:hypothetical protein
VRGTSHTNRFTVASHGRASHRHTSRGRVSHRRGPHSPAHIVDAPYVAAGKIHFGIGEKHRLIGREVRADPEFETRENIIIDVQVALKLPKQTDDGVISIWKRPENGITSTQSSYV